MAPNGEQASRLRWLLTGEGIPYLLTPLIPVAVVLELADASRRRSIFVTSALGDHPARPR